jgi:AraC-like DNA-binding protein
MLVLYIIGASQAIFLFLLSLKNRAGISSHLFSLLLLSFALHLLFFCFSWFTGIWTHISYLRPVFPLLYGPLLLLYIKYQTETRFKYSDYLHFIPFVLALTVMSVFLYINKGLPNHIEGTSLYKWGKLSVISSFAFYGAASHVALKKYSNYVRQNFSFIENIDLKWIKDMFWLLIAIWVLILGLVLGNRLFGLFSANTEQVIQYILICVFVFMIGYKGIRQSNVFSLLSGKQKPEPRIQTETVSNPDQYYFERIKTLVESEKLYLNPKLSIGEIADRLKTNVNYVSRAINSKANVNFFEFINQYRVSEFKIQVVNPQKSNFTLLAIAMECGFNSKASFNRIVKEQTGQTPISLKNNLLHNLRR